MWKLLQAAVGVVRDLVRSRRDLLLENAFLRQQLAVLKRKTPHARPDPEDRAILAGLASFLPEKWRELLAIFRPGTLLRWHREGWRAWWRVVSRPGTRHGGGRVPEEVRRLVARLARENPRWGAKRIVGELKKLTISAHKRTVQRILRKIRPRGRPPADQSWATFLRNHMHQTWACDFFTVTTWNFRQLYVFFVMKLDTRQVLHWAVTDTPSRAWTAQQFREATPWGVGPRFLVRDRDDKFGPEFDAAAAACGTRILKTPPRTPTANSFAERLVGTFRRECLDFFLIGGEDHLRNVLAEFVRHVNEERPHQGIGQAIPAELERPERTREPGGRVASRPVLGGLVHEYRRVA